jgi:type I restriction enzyme S subunit
VDRKIGQLGKKRELLQQYKKGMMQKLFSQEIRFKDNQGNDFPDWEEKRLGEVVSFKNGKPHEPNVVKNGSNNLITLDSVSIEGKLKTKHKTVNINDNSLQENDIVTVLSDIAHARLLGLTSVIPSGKIYILNQRMGRIRANNDQSAEFVSRLLNFNQKFFRRRGQGTSQKHIYERDICSFSAPIPTKSEQQKIADFLSSLDKKIDLITTELVHAQAFKKGLLQQMFI